MNQGATRIDLAGAYRRKGYLIGPLLDRRQTALLRQEVWAHLMNGDALFPADRPPDVPGTAPNIVERLRPAADIAHGADLVALVTEITRSAAAALVGSQLIFQPAHSAAGFISRALDPRCGVVVLVAVEDHHDDNGLRLCPDPRPRPESTSACEPLPLPGGWVCFLAPEITYHCGVNTDGMPRHLLMYEYATN